MGIIWTDSAKRVVPFSLKFSAPTIKEDTLIKEPSVRKSTLFCSRKGMGELLTNRVAYAWQAGRSRCEVASLRYEIEKGLRAV